MLSLGQGIFSLVYIYIYIRQDLAARFINIFKTTAVIGFLLGHLPGIPFVLPFYLLLLYFFNHPEDTKHTEKIRLHSRYNNGPKNRTQTTLFFFFFYSHVRCIMESTFVNRLYLRRMRSLSFSYIYIKCVRRDSFFLWVLKSYRKSVREKNRDLLSAPTKPPFNVLYIKNVYHVA